ncbi:MAG: phasin family protein, partial [Pseudomonadota bacterium]
MNKTEQMSELQKKNIEAAMRLAQLSMDNSQRIMQLQVDTARALFEESVNNARAVTETREPAAQVELRAKLARNTTEKMLGCARQIAEITAETQAEFGRLVGEQLNSGGSDLMDSLRKMLAGMPISSQQSMGTMQDAMDKARQAFEQISTVARTAFQQFGTAASQAAKAPAAAAAAAAAQ